MFKATIIAGLGGFIGTCMRYLSGQLGTLICHAGFPAGTFIANILGCLLIGIFYGWASNRSWFGKSLNLFLITGLCGGFTTFSSFSDEMTTMLEGNDFGMLSLYMILSIIFGILTVAFGIAIARKKKETTSNS